MLGSRLPSDDFDAKLLFMIQKSPTTTWETQKKKRRKLCGRLPTSTSFLAGCLLNHQQYHLLRRLFILLTFRVVDLALNQSRQGPWFHQYLDPAWNQGTICVGESPNMCFGGQICNLDIPVEIFGALVNHPGFCFRSWRRNFHSKSPWKMMGLGRSRSNFQGRCC